MATAQIGNETVEVTGTPGSLYIGVEMGFLGAQGGSITSSDDYLALMAVLVSEGKKSWPDVIIAGQGD
jgi:hypothetical protein